MKIKQSTTIYSSGWGLTSLELSSRWERTTALTSPTSCSLNLVPDGMAFIEANPLQYDRLIVNRPNAHRLHLAPSCNKTEEENNKTIQFYPTPFANAGVASSDIKSAYTDNWKKELAVVPCGTLTDVLLDILPGGRVNFFSLDVEGAEPMVVGKAIDFKRVWIEVLMVEQYNNLCPAPPKQCESREKVREIMRQNNYTLYDKLVKKSDVYIHPHTIFQLPATILPHQPSK